jgi:SAM-dependent methyltransferase
VSRFDKRAYYDSISADYADYVVSPYEIGVEMPLADDVASWLERAGAEGTAVDFGCGAGQSFELIAGRAGRALALDFSAGMLAETARRVGGKLGRGFDESLLDEVQLQQWLDDAPRRDARFFQGDMHRLGMLEGRVDLAIASNSLTDENLDRSLNMFAQVARTLTTRGTLLGLFPSWDATLHAMELEARIAPGTLELGGLDEEGVYEIEGLRQKFWRPEEIERACESQGLRVETLEKIYFPWSAMAESGWGDFEGEEEMWDWYLRATRL